jgi:hypothetical protein
MGYLTPKDYKKTIQADNLTAIIAGDTTILADAEELAVEEAAGHLVQKYDISREFQDVTEWDILDSYQAFDRVYLDAPAFNPASTYIQGAYVSYLGTAKYTSIYQANTAVTAGAFNPTQWDLVAPQYSVYTPVLPHPEFNYLAKYKIGDAVLWKDKVYTCAIATGTTTQELALQFGTYQNIPKGNIFPDDPVNGLQYWGAGVPFAVAPGAEITDTTVWSASDPRSKQVVKAVADLTLYYVHERISPRNVPEQRAVAYQASIEKLKGFAEGDTTNIKLPLIQPKQGRRIRYGGNVKNNNSY